MTPGDEGMLRTFFEGIAEAEKNFFKEDLNDPAVLRRWLDDDRAVRLTAVDDEAIVALAAVWPGLGRCGHVGDLRIVVAADHRRRGLGQELSRAALVEALRRGMTKLTVEVVAEQQGTIDMFQQMGFEPEALLRDQLRDPSGEYHDMVLLAHHVGGNWAEMLTTGLDEVSR